MISDTKLIDTLVKVGVPSGSILAFDSGYELPAPDWILNDLAKEFNKFLFDSGITWVEDKFDCNKFSKSVSTIADWKWAKTTSEEAALAFGMFGYSSGLDGHMLCIAVHCDTGDINNLRVAFYEPQPSVPEGMAVFSTICLTEVKLSEADIKSCVSCLFV